MPNLRGIRSAIGLHVGLSKISVLLVSLPTTTAAQTAALHQYAAVQIVPRGDRVFPIETASADHAVIVVRRVSNGDVVATIDPCAACTYLSPTFAVDGRLAFLARDKGRTSFMLAVGAGARQIDAVAQTLRFSPESR